MKDDERWTRRDDKYWSRRGYHDPQPIQTKKAEEPKPTALDSIGDFFVGLFYLGLIIAGITFAIMSPLVFIALLFGGLVLGVFLAAGRESGGGG